MAKVLVIGSGAREHAIVSKLISSSLVHSVIVSPGNAGTGSLENVSNRPLNLKNYQEVVKSCKEWQISLVVVGPEDPLAEGIVDALEEQGIKAFGPKKAAARIEANKAWAKNFMKRHSIPTARFETFTDISDLEEFVRNCSWEGVAIKASGLAGGKGVTVVDDLVSALEVTESLKLDGGSKLKSAYETIVVEEKLKGYEISVLAFCDGSTVSVMPPAQDHKQRNCGAQGPNTGGMGAYCPCPLVSQDELDYITTNIIQKVVDEMRNEGHPYVGVLYAGLMMTANGPKVLEYNCRFGDPETQSLMLVLDSDLYQIMMACVENRLKEVEISFAKNEFSVAVSVVIKSYPNSVSNGIGYAVEGIDRPNEDEYLSIFLAGVKKSPEREALLTSGGRVLSVCSRAESLEAAVGKALRRASKIVFKDAPDEYSADYRADIGFEAIRKIREKKNSQLSYKKSGVDIESGNSFVKSISEYSKATFRKGVKSDLGLFGAVFDVKLEGYSDPLLIAGTDGVGTKLKLATETKDHSTVGIDLVAMCVNDVLVHAAEPLFFLDYFACGQLNHDIGVEVVKGISRGCQLANCSLVGGETAEMPGMYKDSDYDLAGFVVGAVEKNSMLPKESSIEAGDVLIGIASSGIHSNGFSLVRKMIDVSMTSLGGPAPFNPENTLGSELLKPTLIYTPLLPLLRSASVVGAAHITGGGIGENLARIIPDSLSVSINKTWRIPSVFSWLFSLGISSEEMLRTFNLGIGMILVVKPSYVTQVLKQINEIFAKSFEQSSLATYAKGSSCTDELTHCWAIGNVVPKRDEKVEITGAHEALVSSGAILAHIYPESIQIGPTKRVAVLISGSGTNLQALLDHTLSGPSAAEIVLVISNVAGVEGLNRASRAGVPTVVISHKNFSKREDFDAAIDRTLQEHKVDLVFLAGFMRILTGRFVRAWSGRMVNIHPSLLPSFKGKDAQKQAIEAKVCVSGCSVHFVVEEVDAGAIIAQEAVPVFPNDDVSSLTERIKEAEHKTFPRALELVARNKVFLNIDGTVTRHS